MLSVLAEAKNPVIDNFDMAKSGMGSIWQKSLVILYGINYTSVQFAIGMQFWCTKI